MVTLNDLNKENIRPVSITPEYIMHADGSVLYEAGNTKVICTAKVEEKVPSFLKGTGKGWITCEYSMIPASTQSRKQRDASRGRIDGRTQEIQRLIGRSIRSVVDMSLIGERTIWIDCDVIQADGGTRTASITGGFIALVYCINSMLEKKIIKKSPINNYLAAISVGIVNNDNVLDLCYVQDSNAQVDMNIVMTDNGKFVEIQGTAEKDPFSYDRLNKLIKLAQKGIKQLINNQKEALGELTKLVKSDSNG